MLFRSVLNILSMLNRDGQSIVLVTHDIRAAVRANRLIYMEDGKIVGEKRMAAYDEQLARDREREISNWLIEMEW